MSRKHLWIALVITLGSSQSFAQLIAPPLPNRASMHNDWSANCSGNNGVSLQFKLREAYHNYSIKVSGVSVTLTAPKIRETPLKSSSAKFFSNNGSQMVPKSYINLAKGRYLITKSGPYEIILKLNADSSSSQPGRLSVSGKGEQFLNSVPVNCNISFRQY